jgi:GAF domain-containing protein
VRLREGILSSVALPIHVNGQLWGMIAVGSGQASLPAATEQRMTEFTELVATAVANAQSRAELITSRARIVAASDEIRRRRHRGAGLRTAGLKDRIEALGGTFSVHSPAARGTTVSRQLPVNADGEQ